jgi:hypothetical protein
VGIKNGVTCAIACVLLCGGAAAQEEPPLGRVISLSGPRFGVTYLSDGIVRKLDNEGISAGSVVSQFGWQFEKQFLNGGAGPSAVSEWIVLFGGMEQGVVLPSLTWLVGVRGRSGAEFGVGPNMSPAGTALALAAGVTLRAGSLNLPVNLALVPSKSGIRVSVLCGFNTRKR